MGERDREQSEVDAEDFVELLIRPLKADDPQRRVLRHDLKERMEYAAAQAGNDRGAVEAEEWLKRQVPVKRKRGRMLALWAAALMILAGCVAYELWSMAPLLGAEGKGPVWMREETLRQLYTVPPEEAPVEEEWARPFDVGGGPWRAHPDNTVLFFTYAKAFSQRCRRLPAGYEATWKKIDPDNGVWLIIQAYTVSEVGYRRPPTHLPEAQALLREAAAKPRIEVYDDAWDQYVRDHLRRPETAAQELVIRQRLGAQYISRWPWLWERGMILTAEGQKKTSPGTPEWQAYERINRWIGSDPSRETVRRINQPRTTRSAAPVMVAVIPGCRAGMLSVAMLFLIPTAGLLALRQIPAKGRAGRMATCLAALERPGDRWRILTVALPLPLLLGMAGVLAIHPDRSLGGLGMVAPVLMFLTVATLAAAVASRQISREAGFLGLGSTPGQRKITTAMASGMLVLLAAVTTLVVVNRVTVLPQLHDAGPVLTAMSGLSGLLLLGLGVKVLMGYTEPEANVRHRLIAQRLLPVVLISAILLCLAALALHPAERWAVQESQRQEGMRSW